MKMLEVVLLILALSFLTSFVCLGLYITGSNGYLLFWLKNFIATSLGGVYLERDEAYHEFENKFIGYLWKPFWGCVTCMASVWGSVVYFLFSKVTHETIYELPILILCSAALNFIIFNNLVKKWL